MYEKIACGRSEVLFKVKGLKTPLDKFQIIDCHESVRVPIKHFYLYTRTSEMATRQLHKKRSSIDRFFLLFLTAVMLSFDVAD